MNTKNFETGLQRAYYVVWVLLFCGSVVFLVGHNWDNRLDAAETMASIGFVFASAIGPAMLMYVTRWVYRGFVPKPSE